MALFTRENAAEMARRANEKRWARWRAEQEANHKPATPEPALPVTPDEFTSGQLARVRRQIELLNDQIDAAIQAEKIDAQSIDRLSAAISRLSERERILRNQPLPGSYKPTSAKVKRSYASSAVMPESIETRISVEGTSQNQGTIP